METANFEDELNEQLEEVLHDIKAPLSAILAGIELLDEESLSEDSVDELKRAVKLSAHSVVDMIESISHMRALGKKGCTFSTERLELNSLIQEIGQEYVSVLRAKRVDLNLVLAKQPLHIIADAKALKRVLSNLLSNALRSSPAGSTIRVAVINLAKETLLKVSDNGSGFTVKKSNQGIRYDKSAQGTGLGLTICRRIVSAHNGRMQIRSIPGKGTSVSVFLPKNS